ncbi:LAQU0S22e00826g1_1 [Lachancea quebecensis]|uniref:LAQU0S22e00826g1_1 n=1 Tax=Lachancea quebecensis TaxID=1654605 RepID=A0A0P1KXB7_9SACH|nr:LAQU0S22e00826g1_1 [Lachancea quebecensis]
MHNRSILQNSLLFGAPVALIAGILSQLMPSAEWLLGHGQVGELSLAAPTTVELENVVHTCHCVKQVLGWHEVFVFLRNELLRVNPQVALLVFNLLLILLQMLSSRRLPTAPSGDTIATDLEGEDDETSKLMSFVPRYDSRERALLQFQKLKTKPLNFKYGCENSCSMRDSTADAASLEELLRRYSSKGESPDVNAAKLKKGLLSEASVSTQTSAIDLPTVAIAPQLTNSIVRSHCTSRASSFSRRELKNCPVGTPDSQSMIFHQPSPAKSSVLSTEVTQEQVYSQPFIY